MADAFGTEYQDPFSAISKGLAQGMQIRNEKTKMAMEQAKAAFEKVKNERDTFLSQAGNKDFPKAVRMTFFNNAAALDKQINPQGAFPAIDQFDDQVADVLDAFGVIDKDKAMTPAQKMDMKRKLISQQNQKSGDLKQTEFLQSMAFGAGTPQTVGSGPQQMQGRLNPEGQMVPITAPSAANPAETPKPVTTFNKDLDDRLVGSRKELFEDQTLKDNKFILGELGKLDTLLKENPSGAAGVLSQLFVRQFEKQRISDEDFANLNPSQSAKQRILDWAAKVSAGKKSTLTTEDMRLVSRIVGDRARRSTEEKISDWAAQNAGRFEGTGYDENKLAGFYSAGLGKELSQLRKYGSAEEVDKAVKNKELTKSEGKFIKKDRNLTKGQKPQLTTQDKAAINWAKSNPKDPRSKEILSLHGL